MCEEQNAIDCRRQKLPAATAEFDLPANVPLPRSPPLKCECARRSNGIADQMQMNQTQSEGLRQRKASLNRPDWKTKLLTNCARH